MPLQQNTSLKKKKKKNCVGGFAQLTLFHLFTVLQIHGPMAGLPNTHRTSQIFILTNKSRKYNIETLCIQRDL